MVAHAIKARPGEHPNGQWQTHDDRFRFVYVADGWVELEYEDIGTVRLEKGAMAYQLPMIRRAELAHSDDMVLVEVITPGLAESVA
jgi:quercetin dioxygenase-like cupin family protein